MQKVKNNFECEFVQVIPVGPQNGDQYLMQIDKNEKGIITEKTLTGVRYVPLVKI